MELKEMILLFLSLVTLFQGFQCACDPKPMIMRHEGKKPCVYRDTKGIKTIGVGYNMQNKGAQAVFRSIGADYNKFKNGPVTKSNVRCNCYTVPCLTDGQISQLLDVTLKTAIKDARTVVSTFDSLCCPVQNVMVDMSFNLGGPTFRQFTTFAYLVRMQFWKAAGDDLTVTRWCGQVGNRCTENVNVVRKGCGCSQPSPQACDSQKSACCRSKAQQTCCKGTLTFKTTTFDEQLCCPYPGATCCAHNKCCPKNKVCCPHNRCCPKNTVCCPPPPAVTTYCCPANYPVCNNGRCYRSRYGRRAGHVNDAIEGTAVAQGVPLA